MITCTFCETERHPGHVVLGPGVCICNTCVATIGEAIPTGGEDICTFCRMKERHSRWRFFDRKILATAANGQVRICSGCVGIARNVLRHKARHPERYRSVEEDPGCDP